VADVRPVRPRLADKQGAASYLGGVSLDTIDRLINAGVIYRASARATCSGERPGCVRRESSDADRLERPRRACREVKRISPLNAAARPRGGAIPGLAECEWNIRHGQSSTYRSSETREIPTQHRPRGRGCDDPRRDPAGLRARRLLSTLHHRPYRLHGEVGDEPRERAAHMGTRDEGDPVGLGRGRPSVSPRGKTRRPMSRR
jgi:hypothetical protein